MLRTATLALSVLLVAVAPHVSSASSLQPKSLFLDEEFDALDEDEEGFHRSLQGGTNEDPVWFSAYKSALGVELKRCKNLKGTEPMNGRSCRRKKTGDYSCMFGDQVCPADDSVHPAVKCNCINQVWKCEKYAACEEVAQAQTQCPVQEPDKPPSRMKCNAPPDVSCTYGEICCCDNCVDETTCTCDEITGEWACATLALRCQFPCPATPPPINGDICSDAVDEVITSGEVECCGSVLPQWECTCSGGTYQCVEKNSPLKPCVCAAPEVCPGEDSDTPPQFGDDCSAFTEGKTCSYQETCCCNDCIDSTVCTCTNGSWECAVRMLDCFGSCPPAIAGTTCKAEGELVPVGPEHDCCGDKIPEFACTCTGGVYNCKRTMDPFTVCDCLPEKAPELELPCPGLDTDTPPKSGGQCLLPIEKTCSYKETCCCNSCMDSVTCNCVLGTWECAELAFACLATCPPAISGTSCLVEQETFNEGETECCGSVLPVWQVTCIGGVYHTKLLNDPSWPCVCVAPNE